MFNVPVLQKSCNVNSCSMWTGKKLPTYKNMGSGQWTSEHSLVIAYGHFSIPKGFVSVCMG